jgi:hypothetical protein
LKRATPEKRETFGLWALAPVWQDNIPLFLPPFLRLFLPFLLLLQGYSNPNIMQIKRGVGFELA